MLEGNVRSTLTLSYDGKERDLEITFGLIDRVRRKVPWEKLAMQMGDEENIDPDFAMIAKFVYYNLLEAGFENVSIDDIYDEVITSEANQKGYIALTSQIILAYQPRGSKKKSQSQSKVGLIEKSQATG